MAAPPFAPRLVRWLLVAMVAATILLASLVRPGTAVAQPGPLGLVTRDLWLHGGAYLLLQVAVCYAVLGGRGRPPVSVAVTPVFTLAYGLFVEALQLLVAYRSFSGTDMVANTVGVLLATACVLVGQRVLAGRTGP